MSYQVDIRDQASEALQSLQGAVAPGNVNPQVGAAVVRLFQRHLLNNGTNKQGFPTTNFWGAAARATSWNLLSDGVVVSINKQGVRQRYQGGEITPTGEKKYLTIPARAEAYGKRAGEFSNLSLAFHRVGGKTEAYALAENIAQQISIGKKRKDGSRNVTPGEERGGVIMFWLVKSVHQEADKSVIPSDEEITATALETISSAVTRALQRGGKG